MTGTLGSNPIHEIDVHFSCICVVLCSLTCCGGQIHKTVPLNFDKQDPLSWNTGGPWPHWSVAQCACAQMFHTTPLIYNHIKSTEIKNECYA